MYNKTIIKITATSTYRFETCGNYIFVFDDNYNKLLNTIDIR